MDTQVVQHESHARGTGLFTVGGEHPRWQVSVAMPVSYEVRFVAGLLNPDNPALAEAGAAGSTQTGRRLVVVEAGVHELYGDRITAYFEARRLNASFCVIQADEQLKTMDSVFRVIEHMSEAGLSRRRDPVIAVGGGVLLDIVGLAASLYRRSIPYVRVPTTLIGLVDAGIGAKTGVNFDRHKNRVGSYYPSSCTLLDRSFLATLDERHISNGLAEILKTALIKDGNLFGLLERYGKQLLAERFQETGEEELTPGVEVLRRSVQGMLEELQPNLWEHQLQRLVDYGHSFSPSIEMAALPDLLHGESVSIDMALTTVLARNRDLISGSDAERVFAVMRELRLPMWHPVCVPDLLESALADTVRHRDGLQRLPLPVGIGHACFVNDITQAEIRAALPEMAEHHGRQP